MHIAHVLNVFSVTASAVDQVNYTFSDKLHKVTLIVGGKGTKLQSSIPSGVNVVELENNFISIKGIIELINVIKENKIEILHVHHARSGFSSLIVSKILKLPIIVEDGAKRDNYKFLTRLLFVIIEVFANKVVFVSHSVMDSLSSVEKKLISENKCSVVHYGFDIPAISKSEQQAFREMFSIKKSDILIAHTGRFVAVKNQVKIIKTFHFLTKYNKDIKLVLAGDGPLLGELKNIVGNLNINDKVIFCGILKRNDVYSLLSISDYFIMLSRSEGHSVSLLEAMGYGCIPILSKIDSFLEAVDDSCAVFLDDDNINALWRDVNKISHDDVKNYYFNKYSKSKMMGAYYSIYGALNEK